ncbi:MAG: monomethylamine:corrinoid methyltransferase [Anaerolineae bacterium]|nr:monomethylamine:corrinoid methyltransferase [Anaerolineae bacterium]
MALDLLDVAERAQTGPRMASSPGATPTSWEMGLFAKVTELAQRYDIHMPADVGWFNEDEGLTARAFAAGVDLLVEMGVYCASSERVVQFSREEVLAAARETPAHLAIGQGADVRVLSKRQPIGHEALNLCPGMHAPFDERVAERVAAIYAADPRVDFIEGYTAAEMGGRRIFGPALEAWGAHRQVMQLRHAAEVGGRPGLAIALYPLNTHAGALLAALDRECGLRPGDGMLLSILPDVKMETDLLTTAIIAQDYGLFGLSASFGIVGGFCGGLEGALIEGVAKALAAMLVYGVQVNVVGVEGQPRPRASGSMLRPTAWARSVVTQALNTHTDMICMALGFSASGAGTHSNLAEIALRAIEAHINGANLYVARHSRAQMNAGQTPLEARWLAAVADAARRARLNRAQAGAICARVAESLGEPEPGQEIEACYDLMAAQPRPTYARIYAELKEELSGWGLDFG